MPRLPSIALRVLPVLGVVDDYSGSWHMFVTHLSVS